jgi:hypothetical protein
MSWTVVAVIVIAGILLYALTRWQQTHPITLRPLNGYQTMSSQVGRAVESGRRLHFTLGRGQLNGTQTPASLSALSALDYLAENACASGVPPSVSSGEGTLLVAAQDSLRHAYQSADQAKAFDPATVQFIAPASHPLVYGVGVNNTIHQDAVVGTVSMGHLGIETIFIAEANNRNGIEQVIGSDSLEGMAIGAAVTNNLLIGEELLSAKAYLAPDSIQKASLQTQDILRYVAMIGLFASAILALIGGAG